MKILTPLGKADATLGMTEDEEAKKEMKVQVESTPQSLFRAAQDSGHDHHENHDEDNEHTHHQPSSPERAKRRRPLSLPVLGAPVQQVKGAFKKLSVDFHSKDRGDHIPGSGPAVLHKNHRVFAASDDCVEEMDRRRTAMGPRAPMADNISAAHSSDERSQAFQSIFGRPSPAHHQPQAQPRPMPPNAPQYYQPHYPSPGMQPRHLPPQQQQPPSQYARSLRAPEQPYGYQYGYSRSNHPPSSINTAAGVITSPPPPPPDPSLDFLTSQGLTPAQAYQAQVFATNQQRIGLPSGAYPPVNPHTGPSQVPNERYPTRMDSLNFQPDGGRLSLDFDSNPSSSLNVQPVNSQSDEDADGDSELPWVAGQRTPVTNAQPTQVARQPQPLSNPTSNGPSSTPPIDAPQTRSGAPPKLSLDFGSPPNFSPSAHMESLSRQSTESTQTFLPRPPAQNGSTANQSSAQSGTGSTSASSSYARRSLQVDSLRTRTPLSQLSFSSGGQGTPPATGTPATPIHTTSATPTRRSRRAPLVYPALLSRVAEALLHRLPVGVRAKNGLSYADAFDGQEAVDKICYIIKTTDRSLALLLGRALDAQKFFHDVTYEHRLRDNPAEIYQFRGNIGSMLSADGNGHRGVGHMRGDSTSMSPNNSFSGSSHRPSVSKSSTIDAYSSASTSTTQQGYYTMNHQQGGTDATIVPGTSAAMHEAEEQGMNEIEAVDLPTGVFTMLTECYSSTCTRDHLCYSITCPRRMEQQHRMRNRPNSAGGISTTTARTTRRATISGSQQGGNHGGGIGSGPTSPVGSASGHGHPQAGPARFGQNGEGQPVGMEDDDDANAETGQLWIHTVPKEVADALSDSEKKRQEAINEVIYTERDFVRDMEYLRDVWVAGIRNSDVIPVERREEFISHVFWNILAIIDVNTRLRDALTKRQKQFTVVGQIGDIFQEIVPLFDPFVDYGAHQMYGKYEFEKEKGSNPAFTAFVEEIERLPESRKLELNGYLTKPTTRLARYPLLLEAVLKHTPDSSPDKTLLQDVVQSIRTFLSRVNQKTGEAENRFHLHQLELQLSFRPGEYVDLKLGASHRKMIYKGSLNRRGGAGDKEDLQVFLFDHALLIVKPKTKGDQYKVYRRPIPLEFLVVSAAEETSTPTLRPATTGRVGGRGTLIRPQHDTPHSSVGSSAGHHTNGHGSPLSLNSGNSAMAANNKNGFPITFTHLGWRGYTITLWASTFISKKKWLEHIQKQQDLMRERSNIFETVPFAEGHFTGVNRVNCAAPFRNGRRIVYGTDDGVYLSDLHEPNRPPVKVLALVDVTQVDILEDSQLLIVLAERSVITFPLDVLNPMDPTSGLKRGKRIAAHTSFFKAGICMNRAIVCVVKTSALSTTVKTFEPIEQNTLNKSKPTFKKLLQGGNDTLKLFKEFYIPVESHSLSILRSRLCIGCARGFQILDLESLETQPLVDPSDPSLEFIDKKDNLRPLAIFRVDTEFLLCYDEWAVFVDRRGFRARGDWQANWEGRPTAFAIEPAFIEIWDIVTCSIRQVILGDNLRCLFAEPPPSGSMYPQNTHSIYPSAGPYPPRTSSSSLQQYPPQHMPPTLMHSGRPSLHNVGYGPGPRPGGVGPNAPFGHAASGLGPQNMGRREILLGSDDNVMFLKPVTLAPSAPQSTNGSSGPSSDARQLPI
ncbi:RHO1 GDP-GTP exchange protein 2, partial [Serendipita sp. 399]